MSLFVQPLSYIYKQQEAKCFEKNLCNPIWILQNGGQIAVVNGAPVFIRNQKKASSIFLLTT